jgi:diaminopropionate ammonia-lyase
MGNAAGIVWNRRLRSSGRKVTAAAPARAFHASLETYAPTALVSAPAIAHRLGVRRLWVKDESIRLGLPSFKMLGVSWAVARAVSRRAGQEGELSLTTARAAAARLPGLTLVTATDGNHGHAVARMAALLGLTARIYLPDDAARARIAAITTEGARVEIVDGSYDDAVARSGAELGPDDLLVTAAMSPVNPNIPRWMIDGYATMLHEVHEQLTAAGDAPPALVAVQAGVGALTAAVARHLRCGRLVVVEPHDAACHLASALAGHPVSVPGPHRSIMAGLNCGTPSPAAWPTVSAAVDAFVAIDDTWAQEAMRLLARAGVTAGETGAAGLAGLLALTDEDRTRLGVTPDSDLLVINTEGATAPDRYEAIVRAGA